MFRAYIKFAENEGWKTEIMNSSESEAGGYKEMVFLVKGESVYSKMKFEAGVHRVQRVPATETQGRVHTSAITVAIIPEVDDVEIDIRSEDLKIDTMRASGNGGQSVNTTDSAIRITHLPTGLVVTNQDQKSQHKNKDKAMKVLKARLFDMQEQERMDKEGADRKAQVGSGDRNSIAYEKGLKISDVENALKESLIKTAEKMQDDSLIYEAEIDRENKELKLAQKIEVVANDDIKLTGEARVEQNEWEKENGVEGKLINPENFLSVEEAKEIDSDLDIGDFLSYDLEFESMGRNAATILFSNLEYKLQRFTEDNLFNKYNDQVGDTISSVVTRVDSNDNTFIEIGEVKGILPRKNRIKGETFKVGDALRAVVKGVNIDKQHGLIVEVSRTSPKYLESLLALEVPELKDEKIIIEASARIPGSRAKIALSTIEANIDPIGAIVGVKGVRINSVSEQLNGENIDCIEYTPILEMFVARALSPAIVKSVKVEK
ncbi:Peptide chain release factor 1, partial [Aduncisulcus paluster]